MQSILYECFVQSHSLKGDTKAKRLVFSVPPLVNLPIFFEGFQMNTNAADTILDATAAEVKTSAAAETLLVTESQTLPEDRQREIIARWIGGCSTKRDVLQAAQTLLNRTDVKLNPVLVAYAVVEAETAWGFRLTAAETTSLIVFHTHLHQPSNMVAALVVLNRVAPTEAKSYDVLFAEAAAKLEDAMQQAWSTLTTPKMFGDGEEVRGYIQVLLDYAAGGGTEFGAITQAYIKPGDQVSGFTVVEVVPFFHAPPGAKQ